MFASITEGFKNTVNKIRFRDDEKALKKASDELKKSLLKSDVFHKVVKEIVAIVELETKANGIGRDNFLRALKKSLTSILTVKGNQGFVFASKPPTIVLMSGLQGSGKTTTTGKLAHFLKTQKKKKVMIIAADLQRLAAVEQLRQIAQKIEVELVADENATPSQIVTRGIKKAEDELYDVVLIDTAGRLAIDAELMDELAELKKIATPDEIFYVADSLSGQDAIKTASSFHEKVGITGVILSKFDGDSKGGVAIGLSHQVGVPLRFIGVGEKPEDLEQFIPERIVNRLMGAGDIESLVEKTSAVIDEKMAKAINKKIKKGQFNFNDFLNQLEQMKKMGSMKSLLGMIPGMGAMAKQIGDMDLDNSEELRYIKAMISSMTKKEREDPELLSNSRKRRLAIGAGLDQMQVNRALKQFKSASKVAKQLSSKGNRGMQDMMKQMQGGGFPR
jgi:signal recognition particle subunit SRP54